MGRAERVDVCMMHFGGVCTIRMIRRTHVDDCVVWREERVSTVVSSISNIYLFITLFTQKKVLKTKKLSVRKVVFARERCGFFFVSACLSHGGEAS
jgi:hypothetical protein